MGQPKHFLFGYALEHRVCEELIARGLKAKRIGGYSNYADVVVESPCGQISIEVKAAHKTIVCKPRKGSVRYGYRWLNVVEDFVVFVRCDGMDNEYFIVPRASLPTSHSVTWYDGKPHAIEPWLNRFDLIVNSTTAPLLKT